MVDNHIYQGNELGIDARRIIWPRCMDMNDRALRSIVLDCDGYSRRSRFDITAASEVMAVMCLSMSVGEMKERLAEIVIGYANSGDPITAGDLKAEGAMALLMKEALQPNLVQTIEGVPAFVHGGPFANIAHGCSSLVSTKIALKVSDYVVTEAGFGSDLGAEKFFDIKCRQGELTPNAVVLVVTTKALKRQGGVVKEELSYRHDKALVKGFANLKKHLKNLEFFKVPVVVAINKTDTDLDEESNLIKNWCSAEGAPVVVSEVWAKGGEGGKTLAKKVVELCKHESHFKPLYPLVLSIKDKVAAVAKKIYGAKDVDYLPEAEVAIKEIEEMELSKLPVCIAKTPVSLTDDPSQLGAPRNFKITVKDLKVQAGAGFIVVYTGKIMTMPGLPPHPAAENMDILPDGTIKGLF